MKHLNISTNVDNNYKYSDASFKGHSEIIHLTSLQGKSSVDHGNAILPVKEDDLCITKIASKLAAPKMSII